MGDDHIKVRRIDFSPDEWLQGAGRLDNATRGMYITACALIYSSGGPIDREYLKIATRDHGNAFNRQLERLISLGKLEETDGKLMNKRCGNELEKAQIRSENASENSLKRWKTNRAADAAAMHARESDGNANHQPSTINYQLKGARGRASASLDGVESGALRSQRRNGATPVLWLPRLDILGDTEVWNDSWGPSPDQPGCLLPDRFRRKLAVTRWLSHFPLQHTPA